MRKAKMWFSLVGLSIFSLLILRYFPGSWLQDNYHLNSIIGYIAVAGIFYMAIYLMGLPTLQYFGIPSIRLKGLVAVALAFPAPILQIFEANLEYSSWLDVVSGIAFLLMLGFGEEMLSRGFTYGVLLKLGRFRAILFSSLFFGLLHINVYMPGYLGWETYFHVMSTFGFGMVMCGLMIVTRSIWIPVFFHAMIDWHIPFQKKSMPIEDDQVYSLWDNLTMPFFSLAFDILITLVLLGIDRTRMPNLPKWFWRVALRLKLIESPANFANRIAS